MSISAAAVVTMAEAKEHLGEASNSHDAWLERAINGLSGVFESHVGGKITQQTLTNYRVNGNGCASILLPFVPTQSVTSIGIRYSTDDSVYTTITDTSKFIIKDGYKAGILQLTEDVFICGRKNVLLTMSCGYISTDLQLAAIKEAFLRQLDFDFSRWRKKEIGIQSKTFLDGSIGFVPSGGLLKETIERLEPFVDKRQ